MRAASRRAAYAAASRSLNADRWMRTECTVRNAVDAALRAYEAAEAEADRIDDARYDSEHGLGAA